jgi:hypothetical protein
MFRGMATYALKLWFPHTKYPNKKARVLKRFDAPDIDAAQSTARMIASQRFGHKVSTDFDRARLFDPDGNIIWEGTGNDQGS